MKKIYLLLVVAFFTATVHAQVTGTKVIGVDYPTIAAAVTALNTGGVGAGGATINVPSGYAETVPSGGILLGSATLNASLSAANTLTFVKTGAGVNPILTAFTGGTSTVADGIFKIAGSDYVTIDGIDLKENAANTGAAFMEWGYALVNANAAAPFDGVQFLTIKNCKITLDKTNPNGSMGIYGGNNVAGNITALALTVPADVHSNNKFYSNNISNAGFGIFIGNFSATAPVAALFGQNNDVGGTAAGTGNTVTNIGAAGFNTFGIYLVCQNAANASFNTVTGVSALTAAAVTYGIYFFGATGSATANNNTITVNQTIAVTGAVAGIYAQNTGNVTATGNTITFTDGANSAIHYGIFTASATTANISTNTFKATATAAASGAFNFIYDATTATGTTTFNGNIFNNIALNTSGTTYLIYSNTGTPVVAATNNSITGTFTNAAAGGVTGYYNNGANSTGSNTISGNNFSNITLTGAAAFTGVAVTIGVGQAEIVTNNTFSNVTTGTGALIGVNHSYGNVGSLVNGNTISGFTTGGTITGIQVGGTAALGISVYNNTISALSSTGASVVTGILYTNGTAGTIYKNKISGLTLNNAGGTVYGITLAAGSTSLSVYNNLIGDLKALATTSTTDAIRGINITATSGNLPINVYNNTVYLNAASTGANFSTSALYATTSGTATSASLTLRNNILVNNSVPKGTGITSAYRRSSTTLTNYNAASNNNLFYAGAGCTNNAMYYDGTTVYNTMPTVQTALAPRDANSVTELATPFLSTTGVGATFLHLSTTLPTVAQGGGSPIALVTDDYDGDVRNATTPDIGADEFAGVSPTACAGTPTAGSISGTNNICQGSGTTLTLTGYTNATGINIQWQSSATSGGPYTNIACANGATYNTGIIPVGTTVYYVVVVTCANGGATATTTQFAVTSNPTPTITFTPTAPSVCVGGAGVSVTASGASTYVWSPATGLSATTGATVNANPTATTIYTVVGTSAAGCPGTGTVTVTANTPPGVPVITPAAGAICLGGVQQLNAAAGGSGTILTENFNTVPVGSIPAGWVKNDGSTGVGGSGTVLWTAQATANAGGTANEMRLYMDNSSSVNDIGIYTLRTPSLSAASVTGVTLKFKSWLNHYSAALYPYSIKVQTSTDNVTWTDRWVFTPTGTTVYTPTSETVSLSAIDNQGVFYVRFAADGNVFGSRNWFVDDVSITGTASSGVVFSPTTGLYTNAAATTPYTGAVTTIVYASPAVTTTYTATATGAGGCTSTANVTVTINNPPTVTTPPANQTVCAGNTATFTVVAGGTAPFTYQWQVSTNGGGSWAPLPGETNVTLNVTGTTVAMSGNQYRVVVTNGCSTATSAAATLTVTPPANATISYPSSPYCAGTGIINVTRTGTAGGTYSSTTGLSLNAATGAVDLAATTAGTYTVTYTVAAAGGCPSFTTTASITVNVNSVAPTGATASTTGICGPTGTVNLAVVGGTLAPGASFKWYTGSCGGTLLGTGATLTNVPVNNTTIFYVRAEGICGNTACASVTVNVNPAPSVVLTAAAYSSINPSMPTVLMATVSPVGNYIYDLIRDGVTVASNLNTPMIPLTVDSLGTYQVKVTNTVTGCTATSNVVVVSAAASSSIFITANPNKGQFVVRYNATSAEYGKARSVGVYDEKGAKVFNKTVNINAPYTPINVDVRQHAKGTYYVKVTDANGKILAAGQVMVL